MKVREKLTYTTLIDPTSDGSTCSDLDDLKVSKLKRQNVESIEYRIPSLYLFLFEYIRQYNTNHCQQYFIIYMIPHFFKSNQK